jgi:SAM-dependent methyltransferase
LEGRSGFSVAAVTGERISALEQDFRPDLSQHLAAYHACLRLVSGKVILDGGCGEGYGARYLAPSARRVVGVDKSWEAMKVAPRDGARNLQFSCGDLRELGFRDGSFDVVCSFQVLEHFRQPAAFFSEARRVLRPDGLLILSTPNRLRSFSENPYHFKEYEPEELRALLQRWFPSVDLLGVFGNERVERFQRSRRRQVTRILRFDPLGLRRALPPSLQKWAFARLARWVRARVRSEHPESFPELDPSDFTLGPRHLEEALDLFALCRK